MKYLVIAFVLFGSVVAKAETRGIDFGEVSTRYQIRNELTAWERLRPWDVD